MIPRVLNEDCEDCTAREIQDADTLINFMRKNHPQEWALIYGKYKD